MKGIITNINSQRGMVAVLTDGDGYSIFETSSPDDFDIKDTVYWMEDHPFGDCALKNVTKNETFIVYFQNHSVSQNILKQQLLIN